MYESQVQVAFFSARNFQKLLLNDKQGIHYIEHDLSKGWFINSEKVTSTPSMNSWTLSNFQIVLNRLIEAGPIFSRHYDDLPIMELALRSTALTVLALAEKMSEIGINKCVLGTAASHHLDTLMLEIACQITGIEQIFEYYIFANRVLPLRQTSFIIDRVPLGARISNFSISENLKTWSHTGYRTTTHINSPQASRNFYYSFLVITVNHLRHSIWRLRNKRKKSLHQFQEQIRKRGLIRDLQILIRQRGALRTLTNFIAEDSQSEIFDLEIDRPHFLIMAHFQPEATSFPEGGDWHNFIDIVVELKRNFPDYPILYKEHPGSSYFTFSSRNSNVGISRSSNYYELLRQLGCIFVGDTYQDDQNQYVYVVTITGSVTLERSLQGLSTVVMGEPWYKGIPGMIRLNELRRLPPPIRVSNSIRSNAIQFLDNLVSYRTFENHLLDFGHNSSIHEHSIFIDEYNSFIECLLTQD